MTDYGSSPDLPDVRQVGWASLGSRPLPDLPDVQRVRLVSEAFTQPKMSGRRCWQSYWQSVSQGILISNLTKCAAPMNSETTYTYKFIESYRFTETIRIHIMYTN